MISREVPCLTRLFEPGTALQSAAGPVTTTVIEAGTLNLPDGQIIAADAFAAATEASPLAQTVAPGEYPVVISRLRYRESPYEAVAAAMVRFSPEAPVTWYLALSAGSDPGPLAPDEIVGYAVDSGTGAFMSPASARRLGDKLNLLGVLNYSYIDEMSAALAANAPSGGGWANLRLDEASGLNAVLFETGFGDGVYAAYWGYDAAGSLVCLATDFGLIEA